MLESIPWDSIGSGLSGGIGLAVIGAFWRLMSTGRIVPAEQVDRMLAQKDAQIVYLERALTKKDDTVAELVTQVAKLTVQGDVAARVWQSLPTSSQSGHDHVAHPE